jgi:hypothetical protein
LQIEEEPVVTSEEFDLDSPLVETLVGQFPDLEADLINGAVEDLLQTLEEMQAEAGRSNDDDDDEDELLEELLGVNDEEERAAAEAEDLTEDNQPRTGQWFYEQRNEMLFNGSAVTVLEQCFVLLGQKVKFNLKDNYLDQLCR